MLNPSTAFRRACFSLSIFSITYETLKQVQGDISPDLLRAHGEEPQVIEIRGVLHYNAE